MNALSTLGRVLLEVPVAVVATLVVVRLLGARRSWVATALAGTIGWVSGTLFVVAADGWQWEAARLSAATVSVSVVFTAVAALLLDFVARPGSLARGERAGLIVLPRPWHDLKRRLEPYTRYRELLGIARRNGLVTGMSLNGHRHSNGRVPPAVALRKTLEESGVVFVKLGQMASTRPDLVPPAIRDELSRLQSHVEPAPPEEMQRELESELGGTVEDLFSEFEWRPIGTASVAQAYAARLGTGEPVVVKVQRPGSDEMVARDSAALIHLARVIEQRTPQGRELHAAEVAEEFAKSVNNELDFVREAANTIELADATDAASKVRIPRIYRAMCTRRVLVEERFSGVSVCQERIAELGVDAQELADRLVKATVGHILHGTFHADPHPGNVMLLDDGTLGLIDFGSVGHLDPVERTALMQMTAAALSGDAAGLRDGIQQVAIIGNDVGDVALERALGHFLSEHVAPGQPIDASVLNDLIPLLATYDIHLPSDLSTFFRALALLDGTIRAIKPDYSLVDGMRRVLNGQLPTSDPGGGALEDQLRAGLLQELPRLQRIPAHVDRIATLAERGELRARVSLLSTERDERVVTKLVNRLVLGLVGGLVLIGSALLLTTAAGPNIAAETTFAEVFGFVGLGVAAVLLFRVVAAIVRDGYN